MNRKEKISANIMLLIAAFLWGSSYSFRKMALAYIGAFLFNGIRFFIGFLVIFIAYIVKGAIQKKGKNAPRLEEQDYKPVRWQIKGGILIGVFYSLAANLQQVGLITSDAGKCGFISAFYIFFIPLISRAVLKKKVAAKIWLGAAIAVLGLFLISAGDNFDIIIGDILFILAAICFAIQITMISHYVIHSNPLLLASVQLLSCSVSSMVLSICFERGNTTEGFFAAMLPIVYTGLLSLGLANLIQFVAQKKASPSVAGIVLSLESVFAAAFAAVILQERMNIPQISGCGLIFSAIIISQIERKERTKNNV